MLYANFLFIFEPLRTTQKLISCHFVCIGKVCCNKQDGARLRSLNLVTSKSCPEQCSIVVFIVFQMDGRD